MVVGQDGEGEFSSFQGRVVWRWKGELFGTPIPNPRCSAGGMGIATKPVSEWSFIYPVGRRWWAKNVAMPGGVGSNPDGVPTRKGIVILRACAVAVTRDKGRGWERKMTPFVYFWRLDVHDASVSLLNPTIFVCCHILPLAN